MVFRVELTSAALRDLDALPHRYAAAIVAFLFGALAENPARVGKPLGRDLLGLHGARRGDYRVIYETLQDGDVVLVHRVRHRAHAYRPR